MSWRLILVITCHNISILFTIGRRNFASMTLLRTTLIWAYHHLQIWIWSFLFPRLINLRPFCISNTFSFKVKSTNPLTLLHDVNVTVFIRHAWLWLNILVIRDELLLFLVFIRTCNKFYYLLIQRLRQEMLVHNIKALSVIAGTWVVVGCCSSFLEVPDLVASDWIGSFSFVIFVFINIGFHFFLLARVKLIVKLELITFILVGCLWIWLRLDMGIS